MVFDHINIGILHSLVGKNDGVSIVIDQTVNAMVKRMHINLGNIFFLAAHSSPRFNAETEEIFWHKNEIHKKILENFSADPDPELDKLIHANAMYAKNVIADFIRRNDIDMLIAHNTSHPYNFITAVGLGYYLEELRSKGIIWPKILVWWHDSFFERERFRNPNPIIRKYLKYLPGTNVDGIVFINSEQVELGKRYFAEFDGEKKEPFFRDRACIIPNTTDIPWDWENQDWSNSRIIHPPQDKYNDCFFKDIGLLNKIEDRGFTLDNTIIILQHSRIVPRKKIELAIDFAFRLEEKFVREGQRKCFALLVSGHSGDEQVEYKNFLVDYYFRKLKQQPGANVVLVFGEDRILSHRDIIVDKKYFKFDEVPAIVAAHGGIGTYFSEVEGYGNNLLEMMKHGLPVIINKYDVYKKDIEPLGFDLPAIENLELTDEIIQKAYEILTNPKIRNKIVLHNLKILKEKLDHAIIAEKLSPLIQKMFTRVLN